jgi:hypothetical protein
MEQKNGTNNDYTVFTKYPWGFGAGTRISGVPPPRISLSGPLFTIFVTMDHNTQYC